MTALKELSLHQNSLKGTLPTEVGLLVELTDLNVQGNRMDGDIPTEIYRCVKESMVSLSINVLLSSHIFFTVLPICCR
jgi:hypothetical protein